MDTKNLDLFDLLVKVGPILGGTFALYQYWRNSKTRHSEWLSSLYEKYYEQPHYKKMRWIIDYEPKEEIALIRKLIKNDTKDKTAEELVELLIDYLNFFEFIGSLLKLKQISLIEIKMVFKYYILRIADHDFLMDFIENEDFENLYSLIMQLKKHNEYLFVYGTLRKDYKNEMYHILEKYADFVGEGIFNGILYDIGEYPGAVPSNKNSQTVKGELYSIHNHKFVFKKLDEYEGYSGKDPLSMEFLRKKVSITLINGEKYSAWIYIYNCSTNGLKVIQSGDYVKYCKLKKQLPSSTVNI